MATDTNNQAMVQYIAVFRSIQFGWLTPFGYPEVPPDDKTIEDYVRVSEWQRVEFQPMTDEKQAANAIVSLQKQRARVADDFGKKLNEIDVQIANLRAITHQVAA